jgi:hypothetical protein
LLIKNPLDFSRSRDQRIPGSLLPKRKVPGYEVGFECLEWQKYWWKLEKATNFVTRPVLNVDRRTPFGSEKKCGMHISVKCVVMAKHTRGARVRIKTRKIQNKNFYSPYSNETIYMKALEYKADFTLIVHWENCEEFGRFQVFFRKYMIHCFGLCQRFEGSWKRYFVWITMVLFVLKGGGGGMFAEISTIRNNKNRKHFKLGRDEKLTRLLTLTSKVVRRW